MGGLEGPIVGASFYMGEPGVIDDTWNSVPMKDSKPIVQWNAARFDAADFLLLSPFGIQSDGSFGLSPGQNSLLERVKWVIKTARARNPKIKILATQWWGHDDNGPEYWGYNLIDARDLLKGKWTPENYAQSVSDFLEKSDELFGDGGLDGWDIDYEWTNPKKDESGNEIPEIKQVLPAIYKNLQALTAERGGRKYYVSICPARPQYLSTIAPYVDLIFMQNYSGGRGYGPQFYLDFIKDLQPKQLVYGVCVEQTSRNADFKPLPTTKGDKNDKPEIDDYVEAAHIVYLQKNDEAKSPKGPLGGLWAWRLNSDNYAWENAAQVTLYNKIHSDLQPLPDSPDYYDVVADWDACDGGCERVLKKKWVDAADDAVKSLDAKP